ncbi:MAG: hypothetical protein WBE46_01190 [Dehalococcoidia bacterium]
MFKTNEERRRARFWHRLFTDAEAADGLRFLTLNSSDESIVLGIDILKSFRKLVKRARRRFVDLEYFGVVAYDEKEPLREHIHVICKGKFMPQRELEDMWIDVHRSIKPYIEAVEDVAAAARYIGNYVNMQSYRVRKYIMSADWVFKGWVSWSKRFKRKYGDYPEQMYPGILAKLARMTKRKRDEIMNKLMEI